MGLEPTHGGITIRCLNHLATLAMTLSSIASENTIRQLLTMKSQSLMVGGIAIAGLGIAMALTNPSQSDYEDYAQTQLADHLKENVCPEISQNLGEFLQRQCTSLVDSSRPQLQQLIRQNTIRQNYLVFSMYRTQLGFAPIMPTYNFVTIAGFSGFFIYEAEEN